MEDVVVKNNNYLFMVIFGEEFGLFGFKKWVVVFIIDLGIVNYMLNMDMVGWFNVEKVFVINGVGILFVFIFVLENVKVGGICIKIIELGVGVLDYIFFYL